MIEHCQANLVNYYVCYGSAVVSVRNAERKIYLSRKSIELFFICNTKMNVNRRTLLSICQHGLC